MSYRQSLLAAVTAVALVAGAVSPAAAAVKNVSTTDPGTGAGFTTTAKFTASWSARQYTSEGTTKWLFEKLQMQAGLPNGMSCDPSLCVDWMYTFAATFYNSAGTQVGKITPTKGDVCYDATWATSTRVFSGCARYGAEIPLSAKKMTLSWKVSVKDRFANWYTPWVGTLNVTVAAT